MLDSGRAVATLADAGAKPVQHVLDALGRRSYLRATNEGTVRAEDLSVDELRVFQTLSAHGSTVAPSAPSRPPQKPRPRATAGAAGMRSDARASAIERAWPTFGRLATSKVTTATSRRAASSTNGGASEPPGSPPSRGRAALPAGKASSLLETLAPRASVRGSAGALGPSSAGSVGGSASFFDNSDTTLVGVPAAPVGFGNLAVPADASVPATSIDGLPTEPTCYRYKAYVRTHPTRPEDCPREVQDDWNGSTYAFSACPYNDYALAAADLNRAFGTDWEDVLWSVVGLRAVSSAPDVNLAEPDREPLWWVWSAGDTNYAPDVSSTPRAEVMMRALGLIVDYEQGIPEIWERLGVRAAVTDRIRAGLMSYRIYGPVPDAKWHDLTKVINDLGDAVESYLAAAQDAWDLFYEAVLWVWESAAGVDWTSGGPETSQLGDSLTAVIGSYTDIVDALTGEGDMDALEALDAHLGTMLDVLGKDIGTIAAVLATATFAAGLALFELLALAVALQAALGRLFVAVAVMTRAFTFDGAELDEWISETVVGPRICSGSPFTRLASGPVVNPGASDCACTQQQWVQMFDTIPFTFDYYGASETADKPSMGSNHTMLPPGLTSDGREAVWFCQLQVDRAAIMYDWLVSLATRHFAVWVRNGEAASFHATSHCLRMALAVAAELGALAVHETTHNVSLWHCAEPAAISGMKVGCAQDACRYIWLAFVTARLGLPGMEHDNGTTSGGTSSIFWSLGLGNPFGSYTVTDSATGFLTSWRCDGAPTSTPIAGQTEIQPYYYSNVECAQEYDEETASAISGLATATQVLSVAFWTTGDPLYPLAAYLASIMGPISDEYASWEGVASEDRNAIIWFNIDRPLQIGGNVTWGCILRQSPTCVVDTAAKPFWTTDIPTGYLGCCCA